jgi:hypothetical protein
MIRKKARPGAGPFGKEPESSNCRNQAFTLTTQVNECNRDFSPTTARLGKFACTLTGIQTLGWSPDLLSRKCDSEEYATDFRCKVIEKVSRSEPAGWHRNATLRPSWLSCSR